MKKKNLIVSMASVLALTLTLAGCSVSNENKSKENPFQTVVCAPTLGIPEAPVIELGELLKAEIPALADTLFTPLGMGDPVKDPTSTMGGVIKFTGMVAAKEIDVVISDIDSAAKNARSETFYALDKIFTEEELQPLQDKLISYDKVDNDGNPISEKTPVCGVNISDNETLKKIYGEMEFGIFIVTNTENLDLSKELFLKLANPK